MAMSRDELTRRAFFNRFLTAGALILSYECGCLNILANPGLCSQLEGKKIRWIVPNAPGGGYDTYSRLIEPFFEKSLMAEITIDNIVGAGGMVGAKTIKEDDPDGLTIGILDGSGLLVASLSGEKNAPDLSDDFTILSRIARSRQIWATSTNSQIESITDVLRKAEKRPIVFGTLNVASLSFYNIVVTSHLLGLNAEIVTGYRGSRAGVLAVQRGDVEIISYSFESILRHIKNGDIRPILQVSNEPISSHPTLKDVPILGGAQGLAALRAKKLGRDVREAELDVSTLSAIIGVGRLIAAPKGLDPSLSSCLEQTLREILTDPALKFAAANANRSLEVGSAKSVYEDLQGVARRVGRFSHLIQEAIRKVRN